VGDPFKDTSGPSLDILLKLMAMVSLLIAPLLDGMEDWEYWYVGLIILVLCIIASVVLMYMKILTWQDPLGSVQEGAAEAKAAPAGAARPKSPSAKEAWADNTVS